MNMLLKPGQKTNKQTTFLESASEAEWTPFQIHYFSENLVAPGIDARPTASAARNSDH
jgi:hypothetical protein